MSTGPSKRAWRIDAGGSAGVPRLDESVEGTRNNVSAISLERWYVQSGTSEIPGRRLVGKEPPMDDERKASKAGQQAAEGLREAASKDEAKNESRMGHDLAKGADRFEERSKSSDGKSAEEKQEG